MALNPIHYDKIVHISFLLFFCKSLLLAFAIKLEKKYSSSSQTIFTCDIFSKEFKKKSIQIKH